VLAAEFHRLSRCLHGWSFVRMPAMLPEAFQVARRAGSGAGVDILTVKGPITHSTSSAFQEAVAAALGPRLIVDLTEMPSVDSLAVGALVRAFVSCNKSGRKLAFVGLNHRVRNVLKITGVEPLFDTYASVAEAEAGLS
jgi:anti-sigma B factor antagonist